jgi:23S rRNA (cytidine1920-2'-O)/16S rRNA (cytidine1409-2'-O)-methyltransferase
MRSFVSRAGQKLDHALTEFAINVRERTCADFGCNAGGFTECLLERGTAKVFAIDTGYGVLDYKLRRDARVVVMERTNAMHVSLPQKVDLVVIDVAWTRQRHILPAALRVLKPAGKVVTLIKPHYEADASRLVKGILPEQELDAVLDIVKNDIRIAGFEMLGLTTSPLRGMGGNTELLASLRPLECAKAAQHGSAMAGNGV